MDLIRFLSIYLVLSILAIFLSLVAYKTISRNPRNAFNQMFAATIITLILYIATNFILALITDPRKVGLVNTLAIVADYFIFLVLGFLLLSLLILYAPEKMLHRKTQALYLIIYASLSAIPFFIPDEKKKITISPEGVQSPPTYGFPTFIFYIFFFAIILTLTLIVSWQISIKITNPKIKRKFLFFIVGVLMLYYSPFAMAFANFVNTAEARQVYLFLSLLVVPGLYFVYYGIGKELSENTP